MSIVLQFIIGLTFGLGLIVSGMNDPVKILNFLDFAAIPAGSWDGSLLLVLASAVAVTFIGYRLVLRQSRPILGEKFHLPTATKIDARIIVGPAIFGVGWGIAGFCPGPAFTALGAGAPEAFLFVAAMFVGMVIAGRLARRSMAGLFSRTS